LTFADLLLNFKKRENVQKAILLKSSIAFLRLGE